MKRIARFREQEVDKREEYYGSQGCTSASGGGGECLYISRAGLSCEKQLVGIRRKGSDVVGEIDGEIHSKMAKMKT